MEAVEWILLRCTKLGPPKKHIESHNTELCIALLMVCPHPLVCEIDPLASHMCVFSSRLSTRYQTHILTDDGSALKCMFEARKYMSIDME